MTAGSDKLTSIFGPQVRKFAPQMGILLISTLALIISFFAPQLSPDPAWLAILLCGAPIMLSGARTLVQERTIRTDVLVALALFAALIIGEYFAAGEVALIMQLGELLEEITVGRAQAGLERLVRLRPNTARLIRGDATEQVATEAVRVGDLLRILPGESIPVDGVVHTGTAALAEAVITGEPLPVDKGPGDPVYSGTICAQGTLDMVATQVGEDSTVQRMIRLVAEADAGKARIVRLADRWATWIVVSALIAAFLAWILTGDPVRAVTVLLVFCPCSLVLATPTAITAAMGNASKHRFLVREGDALERLATATGLALDKTGTLTQGQPSVIQVQSHHPEWSEAELFALAAGAEARSEHPLGKALVRNFQETHATLPAAEDFVMLPGRGVQATVQGRRVLVGTEQWLHAQGITAPPSSASSGASAPPAGSSQIFVAIDGEWAGSLTLADTLRPDAPQTVAALLASGLAPILLTGDQAAAARHFAGKLGITTVQARCLPEDKLDYIKKAQQAGQRLCMVGDGVNDAPALKAAHVGIAVQSGNGLGSDLAAQAADIVLVGNNLAALPHLMLLSRRMMRTIKYNLSFSLSLNFAAIALAFAGLLNPVTGALVHNAGSILVITLSTLLLGWQSPQTTSPGR